MSRIRELQPSDRPRERLLDSGADGLSDAELVAILLRTGSARAGVVEAASCLLVDSGGLAGLARRGVRELLRRPGIGPAKAAAVAAALELGRRLARVALEDAERLDRPEVVGEFLVARLRRERQEVFGVVTLDARHRLVGVHDLTRGTRNQSPVDPAEVLRTALIDDAAGVIVFHNHPSGDLEPSRDDIALTRRLVDAGDVVGVPVLDHVVVAGASWLSLRRTHPGLFASR
jgi:DNA repair protein RadC